MAGFRMPYSSMWVTRHSCIRQDLHSLLGRLSYAATIIPQGRVFLQQLFPLLSLDRAPHHFILVPGLIWYLMENIPTGLEWHILFVSSLGWFQLQWLADWHAFHITAKELVPVVLASALWGSLWTRQWISFRSDNMAVGKSCTSHYPLLMHMLRCLAFYLAYYRFQITAEHIPGILNTVAADAISRKNISLFQSLAPQTHPVALPQIMIVDLIVNNRPDWGSCAQQWTHLFTSSLIRDSPLPQKQSTSLDGVCGFCHQFDITPLPLTEHSQTIFAAYLSQSVSARIVQSY